MNSISMFLSNDNQVKIIEAYDSTSRYQDAFLNIIA